MAKLLAVSCHVYPQVSDPEEFVQARQLVETASHPLLVVWRHHRLDVLLMIGIEAITPAAWHLGAKKNL